MTKTLTILIATTALTALVGLPAWSAMRAPDGSPVAANATELLQSAGDSARLILVDDEEDEDGGRSAASEKDDDHGKCGDDDDHEEDEDEDEDEGSCGVTANPSPAGSVAPPKNGLFGDGSAPKVQSN